MIVRLDTAVFKSILYSNIFRMQICKTKCKLPFIICMHQSLEITSAIHIYYFISLSTNIYNISWYWCYQTRSTWQKKCPTMKKQMHCQINFYGKSGMEDASCTHASCSWYEGDYTCMPIIRLVHKIEAYKQCGKLSNLKLPRL